MISVPSPDPAISIDSDGKPRSPRALSLLVGLWLLIFFASLFSPPVLDDADGTHANAARQMALSGDFVTIRVNNVRYLEKAPLPYWIAAASIRIFGDNAFAVHLPQAVAVLLMMLLGFRWAGEAFGERAALYTALSTLTSAGIFLFTRIFIPDVLLSLLLAVCLYCFLHSLNAETVLIQARTPVHAQPQDSGAFEAGSGIRTFLPKRFYPYAMWTALALAVLTKGLVAIVFLAGAAIVYLALTGEARKWRQLRPRPGVLLFLAIAAPWHILAGLRNTGGMNGHGFFWFYFINEHVLRFLGRRIPMDYNKLPGYLYWSLHLVWLFPWSLLLPLFCVDAWQRWRRYGSDHPGQLHFVSPWIAAAIVLLAFTFGVSAFGMHAAIFGIVPIGCATAWVIWRDLRAEHRRTPDSQPLNDLSPAQKTTLLLCVYSFLVLVFFSLSTNQEYYTFPAYLPLLMLLTASLARRETAYSGSDVEARPSRRWIGFAHAAFSIIGLLISAALAYGLWTSRHLKALPNVGDLLAHRGVGDYTLSMSSLFDLTGPSFAALRLPAALALAAFAIGPGVAWNLRSKRRHLAATLAVAITSAIFLVAAHIALVRFAPMLSSHNFAIRIQQLEATGQIAPDNTLLLYGDQAYGSSIPFYLNRPLNRPALLVDGRSSSMLFGSTFPDAQYLFLTPAQLLAKWGTGPRKLLFVPLEHRDDVDRLLGSHQIILDESAGKALITDRSLDVASSASLNSSSTKGGIRTP